MGVKRCPGDGPSAKSHDHAGPKRPSLTKSSFHPCRNLKRLADAVGPRGGPCTWAGPSPFEPDSRHRRCMPSLPRTTMATCCSTGDFKIGEEIRHLAVRASQQFLDIDAHRRRRWIDDARIHYRWLARRSSSSKKGISRATRFSQGNTGGVPRITGRCQLESSNPGSCHPRGSLRAS